MAFPAQAAGGTRHKIDKFNDDGSDVGIGYQIGHDGMMVAYLTILVYPAPRLDPDTPAARRRACVQLSDGIQRDIEGHEADAKLTDSRPVEPPFGDAVLPGQRVSYTGGSTRFDGADRRVDERNDLFCFAGGRWLVAYRVTTPTGSDASEDIAKVVHAIPWPTALTHDAN